MTTTERPPGGDAADEAVVDVRLSPPAHSDQLRGLAGAALELTAAQSVEAVLEIVTEAARAVVGAHQGVTSRLVHGWTKASTVVSLSDRYARWRDYDEVPKGLGVLNFVTRENRPLRLTAEELAAHPEWRGLRDAPDHPPLPSYLAAPLVARDGSNLGLIQLADKADGGDFTAEDEAILVQLAQMASNAIESIELLQREHAARLEAERNGRRLLREKQRAEALQEVGAAITARLDLHDIVQLATDAATELTPAAFGAFFYNTVDERGEALMLYTLSGAPIEAFERFPTPRNTEVFAPTFRGEATVRLDDVQADPRFGRNPPYDGLPAGHLPVRSYLAVSVVTAGGDVAGGMFFGHPEPAVFGEDDERMVEGIAAQAAIAIENARLYRERSETAQTLQRALLPPRLPDIPGIELAARYLPAGQLAAVGGDFYDVFELRDGRWAIVVGDVCGKGPAAATVTALARYTLRAHAMSEARPQRLLALLNDALLQQGAGGFCTLTLACLERDGDGVEIEVASGGHPLPLVVSGGAARAVGTIGTLLGVVSDPETPAERERLRAGDTLVLYTDGVTEAAAPRVVLSADDVARSLEAAADLDPHALAERLVEGAVAGAGGAPRDDIAILVLRVGPAPAELRTAIAPGPGAVARVRAAVDSLALEPALARDVRLLATELVSNAVKHAGPGSGEVELVVAAGREAVRVAVEDGGPGFEPPPRPVRAPEGPGGWGLHLVDARAARWGVERGERTRVWLEIARDGRA